MIDINDINKLKRLSNEYYAIGCRFPDSELKKKMDCIEISDMYNMIVEHYNEIVLLENRIKKSEELLEKRGFRIDESKDIY